jgi:hypothetical protein
MSSRKSDSQMIVAGQGKIRDFRLVLVVSSILFDLALGVTHILPIQILKPLIFIIVVIGSLFLDGTQIIKLTIFILTINALQRRVMAGSAFYIPNDYLILLPFLPMGIFVMRNRRIIYRDKFLMALIFFLTVFTIFAINRNLTQIGWGYLNLVLALGMSKASQNYMDEKLVMFIGNLGVFEAFFVISQKIYMPIYDMGWCVAVRKFLVVNEICNSSSPRLWGSMESAINTGCFLGAAFVIIFHYPSNGFQSSVKYLKLLIIFVGIFLTGSRTFLFLIPIAIGLVSLKRRISAPGVLMGFLIFFVMFSSLPTIAHALNYDSRWTDRLSIQNLSGDTSLNARFNLVQSFSDNLSFGNILFGSGLGTKSRGSGAIDNGFLSFMIEVGLPIMIFFLLYILKNLGVTSKLSGADFSIYSATLILFLSNLSFAVFSGSSSLLFWLFLLNNRKNDQKKINRPIIGW